MVTSYFRFQYANQMGNWIRAEFESQEAMEEAISDLCRDEKLERFERRIDEPHEYAVQRQARRDRCSFYASDVACNQTPLNVPRDTETSLASSRTFHSPFIGASNEGHNVQPII